MASSSIRERLAASSRLRRLDRDDEVDDVATQRAAPGKLNRRDHERFGSVARRAQPGIENPNSLEEGALDSAQQLIDESHGGMTLPTALAARLAEQLGADVSAVRLHTDDRAAKAAALLGAQAFAIGNHIYFARDAYDPTTDAGVGLIAHEVAHTVQRAQHSVHGRVSRPDDTHEVQAEEFAQRFVAGQDSENASSDPATVVERLRKRGTRVEVPHRRELEEQLGTSFDFIEAYTGDAARVACEVMAASAFAVRNIVAFADPSPQRDMLMHELAHVMQMGGRAATAGSKLRPGSITVGAEAAEAEHDARSVVAGGRVAHSSSPNILRRVPTGEAPAGDGDNAAERKKRWETFLTNHKADSKNIYGAPGAAAPKGVAAPFYTDVDGDAVRYSYSSAKPWQNEYYVSKAETDNTKAEHDLRELVKDTSLGLVKIGARRWAWIGEPAPLGKVEWVDEGAPRVPKPNESYQSCCDGVQTIIKKGKLVDFTSVTLKSRKNYELVLTPKIDKVLNEKEAKEVRDQVKAKLIAEPAYQWKDMEWAEFYKDVIDPSPQPFETRIVGDTFAMLAKKNLSDSGYKLSEGEIFFTSSEFQTEKKKRVGDGFTTSGDTIRTIFEAKSGPDNFPNEATANGSKLIQQAQDYAKIVRDKNKITGKDSSTGKKYEFSSVLYTFPKKDIAKAWAPYLVKAFGDEASKLKIFPEVDGIATVEVTANPTFPIELKNKNTTSHHLIAPPTIHPGIRIAEAKINTRSPGTGDVASGEVIFEMNMGESVTGKKVAKKLTPKPEGGGATIENKLPSLKTSLDKILKGVETDAKLTNDGVEATITVKAGPSSIPNINFDGASITAKYGAAGLAVTGTIGIAHKNGKISGTITVGWDGNGWTFVGTATVAAGMVDGLSAFTANVTYDKGKWSFGVDRVAYEKKFSAIAFTGTAWGVQYDVDKGAFSAALEIDADLGMFGKATASAELKDNKLKKAELSYDSPEFTYPAKSEKPAFKGTVGGTVTYNDGKFSGAIRGAANLNIPALKAVAGEGGAGLSVNAQVHEDGRYSGTVATTTPLKFGKHIEVPRIACTLDKEGALSGDFEIKIVKIKHLDNASIKCSVSKDGIDVKEANVEASFGNEEKNKFWGKLKAGYSSAKGLEIGGEINYKIKEGMIATGTLKYSTETHAVSLEMKVSEITLMDKTISKTLFKASKQIPVVNIYGLGIYIDIGFDLGFDFGFKLGLKPTVSFDGLSLETWDFKKIEAKLELLGLIFAQLTGTPKLGIGVFALDPSILRGGGGLKVPIVGRAEIKPTGTIGLSYTPSGGVEGEAKIGMAASFGITGSVKPYAEFAVLNDLWNPKWEGEALASFEILKPKELFNFQVDLAGDMTKKEAPPLPEENAAKDASKPEGTRTFEAPKGESKEAGAEPPKNQTTPTDVKEGGDEGPFSLNALMDKLKAIPGFATAEKIFKIAKKVWDVVKPIYDLVEPLFELIGKRINEFIELFDTELPKSADDAIPWVWKLAKKVIGFAVGGLPELASAIRKMFDKAVGFAKKIVTRAVKEGWIGVKRHSYYIWKPWPMDNYEFMAAAEYKINIPDVANIGHGGPDSLLLSPSSAVAIVLYEALDAVGVGYTYVGNSDINRPYNDFWTGAGARS